MDQKEDQLPRPAGKDVGVVNDYFEGVQKYMRYLKQTIDYDFEGMHIGH